MKWLIGTILILIVFCSSTYNPAKPKPFTTWTKINILPRMCWGPNGNFGTGSNSLLDTFTNKWGNIVGRAFVQFDGDVDPINGKFDFDTNRVGFQLDSTLATGLLQRPNVQDFWTLGLDSQICVIVDLETEHIVRGFAYLDTTGGAIANTMQWAVGTLEDIRQGLLEFEGAYGTFTPDGTWSASATRGWKYDTSITPQTGQFLILRYNRDNGTYPNEIGAMFSTIVVYGESTGSRDTRITPSWDDAITRDTSFTVSRLAGYVEAHPVPVPQLTWRTDTAYWWMGSGGYISPFSTTGGVFDKYNGSFVGPSNTNVKWSAIPYGGPIFNTDDTTYFKSHRNYNVDKAANTYLLTQTSGANLNYIPIDSSTADPRLYTSYHRFKYQFLRGASRTCYEIPDTVNNVGIYLREEYIADNPHPGRYAWELYDYYIPGNEYNAGYRTGSLPGTNYMSPKALFEFHDNSKRGWDSVFDVMPFVSMGFAAWDMESFIEAEFIGRVKYMNREHPICEIINYHTTISTWVRNVDGGCAGNGNSQGFLAGVRNEYNKLQAFIDTMQLLSGLQRRVILTEFAFESHTNFAVPDSTCTNGVSGLGVKQIGSDNVWVSQAKTINQANLLYYFVQGLEALFGYEMMDAADSAGAFYNLPDGAAGRVQGYHNYYKPAFFAEATQHAFLYNYRGLFWRSDSTDGNFNGILRHQTQRDSFCLAVTWGSYTAASSPRTYFLYDDVTTATKKTVNYTTDWTYAGNSSSPTVTSGTVTETPTQDISYYFFRSPALAAALDGPHYFRINKRIVLFDQ